MSVQSVLIEYDGKPQEKIYANSGCLLLDKYVITTSNVLIALIAKQVDVKRKFAALRPGFSPVETLFGHQPDVNVILNNENPYISRRGKVIGAFVSDKIRRQISLVFNDWAIDEEDKTKQLKEVLSLFFIISIATSVENDIRSHLPDFLQSLDQASSVFLKSEIELGDKITTHGTPFGSRQFLRSLSNGIVSNTFGHRNCLILTDAPTTPGCEGGPIYLRSRRKQYIPIGIVLACLTWWKGEWMGLTLAVTFCGIFAGTLSDPQHNSPNVQNPKLEQIRDVIYRCLVQVISGGSWGTAILLDKENGVFITNAHVVNTDFAILAWKDIEIKSRLLFKTAEDEVYDLAILIADSDTLKKTNIRAATIFTGQISSGDTVYAAGFPLFPRSIKPRPTLTKGCVSQVMTSMIKTTCSVLPGSSGGAILTKDGKFLGVIVCNARYHLSVHPRVNMVIPLSSIYDDILNFVRTKDATLLSSLGTADLVNKKQWNFLKCSL